jgi:hypothetical protein
MGLRYALRNGCVVIDTHGHEFDRVASPAEREWWELIERLAVAERA